MDLKVDINPEAINKLLVDTIMESAIGQTLREVVSKEVESLSKSYNNPIELAVKREVALLCQRLVQDQFKTTIEAKVKACLTDQLLEDISTAAWKTLMSKIQNEKY